MSDRWQSPCGRMELRLGDYREALADVQADHCITDPPYSARTHGGHNAMRSHKARDGRRDLSYQHWTGADVAAFVARFNVPGWLVAFTDHVLAMAWEAHAEDAGRYPFAPLPWYAHGSRIRLAGDGPSSWTCWIMVSRARSRAMARWGTLPGGYTHGAKNHGTKASGAQSAHIGGKPLALMRAIVRDYSRPGDLIVDPCAGGGTTLLAAAIEGRRAIGAELDPETYRKAVERLSRGYTPAMVPAEPVTGEQGGLEL